MEELILKSVEIENGRVAFKANTPVKFNFQFNRDLYDGESAIIRCHLYDPIFHLDYYLPDQVVNNKIISEYANKHLYGPLSFIFPEELGGATVYLDFILKMNISCLAGFIGCSSTSISKTIEIKSNEVGAPFIKSVYWGIDDNIEFGKEGVHRTQPYGNNENAFFHIHTRGLYGKMIQRKVHGYMSQEIRIKNNTAIANFPIYNNLKSIRGNQLVGGAKEINKKDWKEAQCPFDINKVEPVQVPKTKTVITSIEAPVLFKEPDDAECRVEFRPMAFYNGEYGFSWFRFGDMEINGKTLKTNKRIKETYNVNYPCNDQPFVEIMGRHFEKKTDGKGNLIEYIVQNGNNSSDNFKKDFEMSRKHKLDYSLIFMSKFFSPKYNIYLIPFMTIMEGQSVELQIHLTVLSKVSKIKFSFDNEKAISENFFSISPSEIISPPVLGKIDLSYKITIQCLKPFAKELRLEARAYSHNDLKVNQHDTNAIIFPQLCGAIKLLPNDISHQRKISVVFISVKTNISGMPLMGIAPSSTAEVDILKKYLGQAYVKADVITETLDLIDSLTQKTDNRYLSCCQQINGQYIGVDYSKRNELQEFLLIKTPNKYEHYFKIFFIPDRCPGLNGFSSGDKFTVCFSTALAETPSHELLHSLGLPHTFDGSTSRAKYIYQDGKTDNIMDYSHFVGVSRHSLFHWQWKAININL